MGRLLGKLNLLLGVHIDDKMAWKQHIHYIKGKISRGIGILCKARKVLNQSALLNLYYSLLYPYFTYGIEVWGSTFQAHINCLTKLQKKIVRIITNSNWRAHTHDLFRKLDILPLPKLYSFSIQVFMHKYE